MNFFVVLILKMFSWTFLKIICSILWMQICNDWTTECQEWCIQLWCCPSGTFDWKEACWSYTTSWTAESGYLGKITYPNQKNEKEEILASVLWFVNQTHWFVFQATPKLSEDKVRQCVDTRLGGEYPPKAVAKVCTSLLSIFDFLLIFMLWHFPCWIVWTVRKFINSELDLEVEDMHITVQVSQLNFSCWWVAVELYLGSWYHA